MLEGEDRERALEALAWRYKVAREHRWPEETAASDILAAFEREFVAVRPKTREENHCALDGDPLDLPMRNQCPLLVPGTYYTQDCALGLNLLERDCGWVVAGPNCPAYKEKSDA